jgi:signal transduction histidine kinase
MSSSPTGSRDRLFSTLARLLEMPAADTKVALTEACDLVADTLKADKVDAFLYDESIDTLTALGSSTQPLSATQKKHGLDMLAVANGGRVVHVFRTGKTFTHGHVDQDAEELKGIRDALGIKSQIGVPLEVMGVRRGMLMAASQKPDFFSDEDVQFAEAVVRWIAMILHRSELTQEIGRNAAQSGRRAAAEEIVTVLAHEVRNHISPLSLRLQVLRKRAEMQGRGDDLEDINLAMKGVTGLSGLVDDLLDVARIDAGLFRVQPEQLDLVELAREVATRTGTPQHAIHVKPREPITVSADAAALRVCLENLFSNAVRHSPDDAPVTVLMMRERRNGGEWACIEVIDQGPGVPEEVRPLIFERFVKGNSRGSGLGLGLYLAKSIAGMHGGDLRLNALPAQGAHFLLELPCSGPGDERSAPAFKVIDGRQGGRGA